MYLHIACYYLLSKKSGFNHGTDTLVSRLIRLSIESALGPTVVALVNLILSNHINNNQWFLLPNITLSHVYGASLLFIVNSRGKVGDGLNGVVASDSEKQGADGMRKNWFKLGAMRNGQVCHLPQQLNQAPFLI